MQIKNLTMSFGTQVLFENINLNIPENEKVGVVGVNGAGKTTFFKIVMGLEYPDDGKIILKNGSRVSWLPQVITEDVEDLNINVLDYLMLGRPIVSLHKYFDFNEVDGISADFIEKTGELPNIEVVESGGCSYDDEVGYTIIDINKNLNIKRIKVKFDREKFINKILETDFPDKKNILKIFYGINFQ